MLRELVEYAERQLRDSEPGFTTRDVRWSIEITSGGRFLNVVPLGDGKRGSLQQYCPNMHGMNAGGKAHFLIETSQTLVLLFKPNENVKTITRAREKHQFFVDMLREASTSIPALTPLVRVLDNTSQIAQIHDNLAKMKAKPTDWVGWRVDGHDPRQDKPVQTWWRNWRRNSLSKAADGAMLCLLSGDAVQPLSTHPKISGLSGVGGLGTGDVVVGFDKAAFRSYGLEQSANAAMSAEAAQKYIDGLNDLIRNHSRKLGNSLIVYWYKDRVPVENDPLAFLYGIESAEQTAAAALGAAHRLLEAIDRGQRPDLGNNRYFALTLSGAAGRVMVRDWMEGAFEDLVRNIEVWFADLAIVSRDGNGTAFDPKFLAVCGALVRELKDLPAPTAAILWQAALQRIPIPLPLMVQALARFRSDLLSREQPPFNHARMGLIKAYFVRHPSGEYKTMSAYLNPDHPAAAYHCGRLLAILANLQRAALGDVGAGVVQRYYPAASQTPGLVLGRLIGNARNHLGKIDGGLAFWYESQIAEVMSRLHDYAPRILDLEGQGLFALGYYQQLAALRGGNKSTKIDSITEQGETK